MYKFSLGLLLLCLYACGPSTEKPIVEASNADSLVQQPDPITTPMLVQTNNKFSITLWQHLFLENEKLSQENIFISPYSIATAFAMLYLGSSEQTERELSEIFAWQGNTPAFHAAFKALNQRLTQENKDALFQIYLNNQLWIAKDKNLELLETYQTQSKEYYAQEVAYLDFNEQESAEKTINDWIKEKTKGKIPFLYQKSLSTDLVALLVNSIYFAGNWAEPFDKNATKKAKFTTIDNKKVEKEFMHKKTQIYSGIQYFASEKLKALQLPYADDNTSLLVILPTEKLSDYINQLSGEDIDQLLQSQALPYDGLTIELPKWKTESTFQLAKVMAQMGLSTIEELQVPKMTPTPIGIGEVLHKTFIEVDEEKTVAAAVTAIEMKATSAAPSPNPVYLEFKADRPFLYCIVHKVKDSTKQAHINNILFMGQVVK